MKRPTYALGAALAAILLAGPAAAQTVEQFYTGKQLKLVVGSAAGSGYDSVARMAANVMPKYLPGKPTIVVQNMPAGSGIAATNHMYNVADKDGSAFAVVQREAVFDKLLSGAQSQALYDSREFTWIGTPAPDVGMAYATTKSGFTSIQDVMKREAITAAAGASSGSAVTPRLLNALIGTKFKIVTGYQASMDALLAMERGEADARVNSGWTGPETVQVNEKVAKGEIAYLIQIGLVRMAAYPTVPHVLDFVKSDEDTKLMTVLFAGQSLGRPFFAPPGIPADRAKALRDAFMATMKDPEFVADAKKQYLDINPTSGEDMLKLVNQVHATPEPLLKRAIEITAGAQK
jgi:tripartite-type tricarboxylate transporter receptor subunit TctC